MKIRFREWSAQILTFVCLPWLLVQPVFAAGPNDARPAFPPGLQLRDKLHGEAAIEAIRNELPAVAAFYRKTPEQLEKLLRQDNSLWVDRNGRLFYVCDLTAPATADTNVAPSVAEIAPLSQTFLLHSRPGSTKTIFLDFDGYTISGTQWNTAYNSGADIVAPPWDTDGNPASFSTSEQTAIQQIWLRVAEDYAPYDVDVTTEFPGEAAITRSSSSDQIYGTRALVSAISSYFGSYGGIAYVGVFDGTGNTYKPALIFPEKLGNSEKNIAEAISHEVGHNLGLSHDGIVNGADYYSGQGNWAPIMGVGYYEPISQWSKGEYANADNTEDDLTIITQNGLSYRTDDHGNSTATATALSGTSIVTNGVIERQTDLDFFSFPTGAGTAQFTVTPWERGADLHLLVSVYNSAGTLVTNREVADTSAGVQPVSISVPLGSGTYYLSVQGVGVGDPFTTGYSDYANLGQYTVSISLPGISSWIPVAGGAYSWTNLSNWSAGVPSVVDANARLTNNLLGNQTIRLDSPVTVGRLLIGDTDDSHNFTITDESGGSLIFKTTAGDAAVLKNRGSADVIASGVNLQARLIVSNGSLANLTFSGSLSGPSGFVKSGAGLVTLSGTNTYLGDTTISNGVLAIALEGSISNSPKLDLKSGGILDASAFPGGLLVGSAQTVAGSGVFLGDAVLSSGSSIAPGSSGAAGTLTFSNNLIVPDGGVFEFDLAASNATGGGTNDLVVVAGQLSLAGTNFFSVGALAGQLASPGTYTVLKYGTMSGGAANLLYANPTTRYAVTADDSVPGEIQLQVSGNALPLTWRGDGIGNTWNVAGSSNWFNGTAKDRFYQFDSVSFDDSGSNSPSINLTGTIIPTAFVVNASKSYTFSGAGKISGATGLAKSGSGTLTLNNANDFTGAITVSGGILKPANATALGNPSAITIQTGGTLDFNALSLGNEPVTVQGAGVGNSGALINSSGTAQVNALQLVTLAGDATIGGVGRWDIRANPTGGLAGNGYRLTKVGANEIRLAGLGATALGNIDVRQGSLGIESSTTLGNAANTLALWSGTSLAFADTGANALSKVLQMTNAVVRNDTGVNSFLGPVTLTSSNHFNITSSLNLKGPVAGSGTLAKSGVGTLILSGTNNFTGPFYLDTGSSSASDGVIKLANSNALSSASLILLRNNNGGSSTLQLDGANGNIKLAQAITLSGRNNTIAAIQSIAGSNTLSGNVTFQTGGGNYVFQSDAGTLALTGTLPTSAPSGTRTMNFQGSGAFLVSSSIQNSGATIALTKSGSGKLTITGNANTYTGLNTIDAGTVQLGNGGPGGRLGTGPVVNNGLLQFDRSDNFTWSNDVSGTNGQFIKLNVNTVTLTSTNAYLRSSSSGAVQINGGTVQINATGRLIANNQFWIAQNASTGACVIYGGALISSNWLAVGRNSSAANGTLTLNSGSIQKYGSGNIILGSLGGIGTLTVNGGVISNNAQLLLAENATGQGYFNLNGGVVQASALGKFGGLTAIAKFNGGTLQATTNSTAYISGLNQALIQAGGFILDDGGFGLTNAQVLLEDVTSPGGGFIKKGNGLVSWNTGNTFRGDTRIAAGTLRLGIANAFQYSTLDLASADNGSVDFGTLTVAIVGGLAGTRNLTLVNANNAAVTLSVGNNSSNSLYSGSLNGSGGLTKIGSGVLTLSGANNYAGTTFVSAGTLFVDGSLGSGAATVNGGVLGGNGIINGPVTVQANGTLAPGTSIGALTVNNNGTLLGKTIMEISGVGPSNDALNVSGTLTLGGTLIVTNVGPALTAGASFNLFNAGSLSGSFASVVLPELDSNLRWNTNQLASAGTLSIVAVTAPLIAPSLSGTNLVLQFPTEPGVNYILESTIDLNAPVFWQPQQTNQGNGSVLSIEIPIDAQQPQSFFRLLAY